MHRSFDPEVMKQAFAMLPDDHSDIDYDAWVANDKNIVLVEGDNVGLATFEYPGLYTVHWFYTVRGRAAIKLAREMLKEMFEKYGAEVIRGITPTGECPKQYRAARWLAKQVGLKSYGDYTLFDETSYEIQCITKEEFYGS